MVFVCVRGVFNEYWVVYVCVVCVCVLNFYLYFFFSFFFFWGGRCCRCFIFLGGFFNIYFFFFVRCSTRTGGWKISLRIYRCCRSPPAVNSVFAGRICTAHCNSVNLHFCSVLHFCRNCKKSFQFCRFFTHSTSV